MIPSAEDTCFYNLNTINGLHSFIKQRYVFYRGVTNKYINRYNALFLSAYRNAEGIIKRLIGAPLMVTGTDYYHSNRDVREASLLTMLHGHCSHWQFILFQIIMACAIMLFGR